jgi:hypothetical protein
MCVQLGFEIMGLLLRASHLGKVLMQLT